MLSSYFVLKRKDDDNKGGGKSSEPKTKQKRFWRTFNWRRQAWGQDLFLIQKLVSERNFFCDRKLLLWQNLAETCLYYERFILWNIFVVCDRNFFLWQKCDSLRVTQKELVSVIKTCFCEGNFFLKLFFFWQIFFFLWQLL